MVTPQISSSGAAGAPEPPGRPSIDQRQADPVAEADRSDIILDHLVMEQYDSWLFGKNIAEPTEGRPVASFSLRTVP
jgi:hypothetical protein